MKFQQMWTPSSRNLFQMIFYKNTHAHTSKPSENKSRAGEETVGGDRSEPKTCCPRSHCHANVWGSVHKIHHFLNRMKCTVAQSHVSSCERWLQVKTTGLWGDLAGWPRLPKPQATHRTREHKCSYSPCETRGNMKAAPATGDKKCLKFQLV